MNKAYKPCRKYIVNTKFECLKPKAFRGIVQNTNDLNKIHVSVPRYGRWCFNTATHTMTKTVFGEDRLARITHKLDERNVWHAVGLAV